MCIFFAISDNDKINESEAVDLGMIDVRYWKLFNAKYADDDEIGTALYDAQTQCFKYEGQGVQVSQSFADKLAGDEDDVYPILSNNTSQEEYDEAMWVMNRYVHVVMFMFL